MILYLNSIAEMIDIKKSVDEFSVTQWKSVHRCGKLLTLFLHARILCRYCSKAAAIGMCAVLPVVFFVVI